jgi:hypothetical protein
MRRRFLNPAEVSPPSRRSVIAFSETQAGRIASGQFLPGGGYPRTQMENELK